MKKLSIKEIQSLELDIIRAFDCFAKEQHLRWYLAGGTLIGAVRHQGFIPWDDDIDIMMPREDYEKMLKTFRHERYRLSECRKSSGAAIPFAQIYDSQTFLKWKKVKDPDLGVFIDIFPIDGYPENEFAAKIHTRHLWLLRFMNNVARKKLCSGEKYMLLKRILMLLFRKSPNSYSIRIIWNCRLKIKESQPTALQHTGTELYQKLSTCKMISKPLIIESHRPVSQIGSFSKEPDLGAFIGTHIVKSTTIFPCGCFGINNSLPV